MSTSFLTYECHDLTWGDHGDELPCSFLLNVGSIWAYLVSSPSECSSFEPVKVLPLAPIKFVHANFG